MRTNDRQTARVSKTWSATSDRTMRTGRAGNGTRVREESWDGRVVVWNKTEGREATREEVETTNWTTDRNR